jgi:nitroreductase
MTAASIPPDELAELIRNRRSIDLFEPDPVGTEVLLDAIELARWAPNHRLTEPWRFYVLGPETIESVARLAAEIDAATKGERARQLRYERVSGIPGHFVLTSRRSDDELMDRENYAACCCAVQNLMVYLWNLGIGTKWTTGAITRDQRFYDLLGIDAGNELIVGHFWYGRPKVVPRKQRKDVAEIVVERA